jgi:hypothetical protein
MAQPLKKTEKAGKSMDLQEAYEGAVSYLQKNCPEYLETVSKTDTMSNPRYAALLADVYANTAQNDTCALLDKIVRLHHSLIKGSASATDLKIQVV